jgi:hypothetical protein
MKKLYTLALCLALFVACSDNLFGGPSTDGNSNDIKSLRIDAENAFRKGDYEASYNICKKIVEINPSAAFGYYGMAKASIWKHGVNPFGLFSIIMPKEDKCPFIGETMKVQNGYLQAMKEITFVLSELDRRDSLTKLYDFHVRARENKGWDSIFTVVIDSVSKQVNLNERLLEFRKTFCKGNPNGDCSDTISYNKISDPDNSNRVPDSKKSFPLSDKEYTSSYFGGILFVSVFSKWFLGIFDMNNDGCLTRKGTAGIDNPGSEWEKWGCTEKYDPKNPDHDLALSLKCEKDDEGKMSVVIDTKQILEDLQEKLETYYERAASCTSDCNTIPIPSEIENLNNAIDNFGGTFDEVEDMLNSLGLAGSLDDTDEDPQSLKDEIDKYKAYASFYKVGTHIDEDGDGCIDEDLLDMQDNDGDGLANANARLASTDPSNDALWGVNPINNSMYGNNPYKNSENWEYNKPVRLPEPVFICSDPNCSTGTELWGDSTGMVTVIAFTQEAYPDGSKYWTSRDMDLKLAVAQDTVCGKLKFSLKERKEKVGGCWPYYDENKFIEYWLKRKLAHPDLQETRVAKECKQCTGAECLKEE